VNDELRGFRISSARTGRGGPSPVVLAAGAVVLLAVILVLVSREDEAPVVTPAPTALPSETPTTVPTHRPCRASVRVGYGADSRGNADTLADAVADVAPTSNQTSALPHPPHLRVRDLPVDLGANL